MQRPIVRYWPIRDRKSLTSWNFNVVFVAGLYFWLRKAKGWSKSSEKIGFGVRLVLGLGQLSQLRDNALVTRSLKLSNLSNFWHTAFRACMECRVRNAVSLLVQPRGVADFYLAHVPTKICWWNGTCKVAWTRIMYRQNNTTTVLRSLHRSICVSEAPSTSS